MDQPHRVVCPHCGAHISFDASTKTGLIRCNNPNCERILQWSIDTKVEVET